MARQPLTLAAAGDNQVGRGDDITLMSRGPGLLRRTVSALIVVMLVCGLGCAAPAGAAPDQCTPSGEDGAIALPKKLATANRPNEDKYTTPDVEPLTNVNVNGLGLSTPGTLRVATLSQSPPNVCINSAGRFTGFDNELLQAIAKKLDLQVSFVGTDFAGLLAQVAAGRFDVGSASITATDARRRTVSFTNGYDFGYFSLVVPAGSAITGFDHLAEGQRIGVVQGTVEESYVVESLHLAAGEVSRLHQPLRQPQDTPGRCLGGAGDGGTERRPRR